MFGCGRIVVRCAPFAFTLRVRLTDGYRMARISQESFDKLWTLGCDCIVVRC